MLLWRCGRCQAKNHRFRDKCVLCGAARGKTEAVARGSIEFTSHPKRAFSKPPNYVRTRPSFKGWRRGQRAWVMVAAAEGTAFEVHSVIYIGRSRDSAGMIAGIVYVEREERIEPIAAERVFETEADANEEMRAWNRFIASIPPARPENDATGTRRITFRVPAMSRRGREMCDAGLHEMAVSAIHWSAGQGKKHRICGECRRAWDREYHNRRYRERKEAAAEARSA